MASKTSFRKVGQPNFTQVNNDLIEDETLSLKAKGLYGYLISKPDGRDFAAARIARESKDGTKAVESAIRELEDKGWVNRKKQPSGRMEYLIYWNKMTATQKQRFDQDEKNNEAKPPNTQKGGLGGVSNTDLVNTNIFNNTTIEDIEYNSNIYNTIELFIVEQLKAFPNKRRKATPKYIKSQYAEWLELEKKGYTRAEVELCIRFLLSQDPKAKGFNRRGQVRVITKFLKVSSNECHYIDEVLIDANKKIDWWNTLDDDRKEIEKMTDKIKKDFYLEQYKYRKANKLTTSIKAIDNSRKKKKAKDKKNVGWGVEKTAAISEMGKHSITDKKQPTVTPSETKHTGFKEDLLKRFTSDKTKKDEMTTTG